MDIPNFIRIYNSQETVDQIEQKRNFQHKTKLLATKLKALLIHGFWIFETVTI